MRVVDFVVVGDLLLEVLGGGGGRGILVVGVRRGDSHTEFHGLSEPAAECVDDVAAQVPFDFVLHESARHRKQREALDEVQRSDELEPGALLRGQDRGGAVVAVEFGDHVGPQDGE